MRKPSGLIPVARQQTNAPNPSKTVSRNRNITVTIAIIAVIAIAGFIAARALNTGEQPPSPVPFDFRLDVSPSAGTMIQGKSLQTNVTITLLDGSPQQVTLNVSSPDGVTCVFSPQSGTPNFTSSLTMNVSESIITGAFPIVINATGGGKAYQDTYDLSVLSANIRVFGSVTISDPQKIPSSIKFVDAASGQTIKNLVLDRSYSVNLQNLHTYNVIIGWGSSEVWNVGEINAGVLSLYEGVGVVSLRQNYAM